MMDKCYVGIPKWLWTGLIAPIGVTFVVFVATWVWSQEKTVVQHTDELKYISDKVDKVDRDVAALKDYIVKEVELLKERF